MITLPSENDTFAQMKITAMKILFVPALCIALLAGCGNSNESARETARLEKALQENPGRQNANALIDAYISESQEVKDKSKQEALFEKALQVALDQKVYGRAMGILQELLLDYPHQTKTVQRLAQISQIFRDMKRDNANAVLIAAMREKYPDNPTVKELTSSGNISSESSETLLTNLGTKMFNDSLMQLEKPVAREYVDACEAYALVMQDDPSGAEYLHKGAETARSLQTLDKALFLYDWIIKKYPEHPRAAQSLFLKAFTLDNDLNQFEEAKKLYEEFLQKYPKNEFAPSAQFLLDNLGKSDEELLESLQQRSKEEN